MADPSIEGIVTEWLKQIRDDIVSQLSSVGLVVGDIEIGAVELKDFDSEVRKKITKSENIMVADDVVMAHTFLDPTTDDKRISTIVYTSASVHTGETVTETYTYSGSPGAYYLNTITRVLS